MMLISFVVLHRLCFKLQLVIWVVIVLGSLRADFQQIRLLAFKQSIIVDEDLNQADVLRNVRNTNACK